MNGKFSSENMDKIVKELSSFPRLVGSSGEIKGMNYCKKIFSDIGVELKEDSFKCVKGWVGWIAQMLFFLASIVVVVMGIILWFKPWANIFAFVLLIVLLVIFAPSTTGMNDFKMLGKVYTSKNLIQTIPPKQGKETKQYILLTGHYDSKSQPLTTIARSICYVLMIIGVVMLLIVVLAGIIVDFTSSAGVPLGIRITGIVFMGIALCGLIPVSFNSLGNNSPGAIDNASSIAVIHDIARVIKEQGGLENTEVIICLFSAEEIMMWGSRDFVKKYLEKYPPEKTKSINIDMIGYKGAPVEIMETFGIPTKKPISPFLTDLAFNVAKEKNIKLKGFWMPIGATTDGFVLRDHGYDGCEFVVMDAALHTHHKEDDFSKWDGNIAVQNCEIIHGMIEKIDVHGFNNTLKDEI